MKNETEIQNVRLTKELRLRILRNYVSKIKKSQEETKQQLTAELGKWHTAEFPELKALTDKQKDEWFSTAGRFEIAAGTGRYFTFLSQTYFPRKCSEYKFIVNEVPAKIKKLVDTLQSAETEEQKFYGSLESILNSVSNSKQLCELLPEMKQHFPLKSTEKNVAQRALIPVETLNYLRKALNP